MSFLISAKKQPEKIRQINDHFLLLLEKELIEATRQDDAERANGEHHRTLGWDCDRETWLDFTKIVSAENDRRKLYRRI